MTRREIPLDAHAILRVLAEHGVDYVLIGGVAVQAHGHPRTTQDMDLTPNPNVGNLARLRAALIELHARPVGAARPNKLPLDLPPKKGISAEQLQRMLKVSHKTASRAGNGDICN